MKVANFKQLIQLNYASTEALNTICSNLCFAGRNLQKIVMTSCSTGDGKSYLTNQIAQNLARRGKRVVVVDADLRRSRMIQQHRIEIIGEAIGLAHYLAGYHSVRDILYKTNLQDVYIIPAGRYVANPIPLFNTVEFGELLNALAAHFDYVLVDAPPVGMVIDAAEIAQHCDGCVLVLEYEKTRRQEALMAKRQLEQTSCPILGTILNKVTFHTISSQKYYRHPYYSHYSPAQDLKPLRRPKKQRRVISTDVNE